MYRYLWIAVASLLVVSPELPADEGIPEKKLEDLKAATVFVKVHAKEGTATGSGFLFRVDGDTGLVATNHHVVAAAPGRFTPQKIELVFWSGTKKEQVLAGEVLGSDAEQDLAVLKVTVKGLPAPLDLAGNIKLRETMTIYTLGFPLGELLSPTRTNPAVTIGKGTISSLREDGRGKIRRVQLDGELNPGNSGGPVVDADGKLVGIAVSKILGTKISFAISPAELTAMLKGYAASVVLRHIRIDNGIAELEVEVPLIDPLRKLKAVEIRHARKDTLKQLPQPDEEGKWATLSGGESVEVKITAGKAITRITLKATEKKALDWLFQTAYSNEEGKSVPLEPVSQRINFGGTGSIRLNEAPVRPWVSVSSREGGFTVDMPVKPMLTKSSTRKTAVGPMKMLLIGCGTENGAYLAFRIDLPKPVAKDAVPQVLDALRDHFAEEWKGKVIREKKVLAQGNAGRDFTIRGKPDDKGVSAIRMRQYLVDKAVFAVAVHSLPDQELPMDAGRFLGSLSLGDAKIRATGTPEPEPKGTELAGWGLAIDPDQDCKFIPGKRSIAIEVPAAMHDLGGALHKVNAPRVMRDVDGDFTFTVKVEAEFKPGPKSTNPKGIPYLAAGILTWSDSDNFIRLERAALLRAGKVLPHVAFLEQEGGYGGAVHNEQFKAGSCYLRMERTGSRIQGAMSSDGSTWKQLQPIDTVWPDKLKVGLSAITTSSEPFSVKFDEFELKTSGSAPENSKP
jgi:regulation of enolase protein 1 (concanavalin A-like superfamily)